MDPDRPITPLSVAPGARLGPYEILAPLGAGGMGEVFYGMKARPEHQRMRRPG